MRRLKLTHVCLAVTLPARRTAALSAALLFGFGMPVLISSQPAKPAIFPTVSSDALDKAKITVPAGFEGEINLLLVSFAADQQNQLETWSATGQALQHTNPGFRAYRIPVAEKENAVFRWWANASLRSEETDPELWHWVLPLYVDKPAFCSQLGIADEKSIAVLLVDRGGRVLWRTSGASTPESRSALVAAANATH